MEENPNVSKCMKRKLRRRAAKAVMIKLKADELQMKIDKVYVQSSDNSSEVSSNIEENSVLSDVADDECYCDVPEESNNSDTTSVQVEQTLLQEHLLNVVRDIQVTQLVRSAPSLENTITTGLLS
ncbi:PREDICTED: uncharacterized protein LOC105569317 [Vollenhovia emeryi]|uniref:uncharacterized protein LOC105569317 n=1 Tax=Vollenhovia emeryi TaxID=411798 RepID=UPI0005F55A90|nr:PREDICTED: uncharacterized protein LOC105569317 [Vollenhovia emeryi]